MRSLVLAALLAPLVGALGCSADVGDDAELVGDAEAARYWVAHRSGGAESVTESPHGTVAIHRVTSFVAASADDAPLMRSQVSARFVRATGDIDAATAHQVVAPSMHDIHDAEVGCVFRDAFRDRLPAPTLVAPGEGAIELLDVGEIVLHARDAEGRDAGALPLAARAFPDVGDLVSGVVYTSRDDSAQIPVEGTYLIETMGSARVAGFSLEVEAPASPAHVRVAGMRFDGALRLEQGSLPLRWEVPARPGEGDRIVVELLPTDGAAEVRCVFEDEGAAEVPAGFVAAWADDAEVDISFHRVRRRAVDLVGAPIHGAVVDFDFALSTRASF